ncbi:carbon-nitrogen hydrolase family protein (plasmid) [Rhodococcus opacus]|uniref:carbon-nitrogen hydrolase family protein n=1 Tax=Rhodococcus opacus TaxID=37919 RepID=UPI0034D36016
MTRSLSVGVGQLQPTSDRGHNLERIEQLTRQAAAAGTDLLIFPELAVTGWGSDPREIPGLAEPIDGPSVQRLARLADETGVTVVCGLYEIGDDASGRPYNTQVAVAPDNGVIASHRKVHLYDAWGYRESDEVQPGAGELATLTVNGIQVGLMNCYEVRFPERAYALVDAGCDVLAVSAAWARGPLKEEHWQLNVRARAVENTVWIAAASLAGPDVIGRSLISDPLGVARVQLDESAERWAAVEADPERMAHAQRALPIRKQRSQYYHSSSRAQALKPHPTHRVEPDVPALDSVSMEGGS